MPPERDPSRRQRRFRHAVITALVIGLLGLGALEAGLATWYRFNPPVDYRLLDPELGSLHFYVPSARGVFYGVRSHFEQRFMRHEFDTRIRTNDIGLREGRDTAGVRPDIAFVGDSFTFGWGVEATERYSAIVSRAFPELEVFSLSYPNGHAPPFYLSFLQHHPELVPETLVLGLFAFNDLAADMRDTDLVVDAQTGRITRAASRRWTISEAGYMMERDAATGSLQALARHTALGRTLRVLLERPGPRRRRLAAPEGLDAGELDQTALTALGWVRALADFMRNRGGELLVLYVPTAPTVGEYRAHCPYRRRGCSSLRENNALGDRLAAWFARHGIAFLDPVPRFRELESNGERLYFARDGHWTPAGHRAAGELVAARLSSSDDPS